MAAPRQQGPPALTTLEKQRLLLRSHLQLPVMCKNSKPCPYGDRCMFAHTAEEARVVRACQEVQRGKEADGGGGAPPGLAPSLRSQQEGEGNARRFCHPAKYKTAICVHWERFGECRHGPNCNFAHGEADLRPSQPPGQYHTLRAYHAPQHSGGAGPEWQSEGGEGAPEEEEEDQEAPIMAAAYPAEYAAQRRLDEQRQQEALQRQLPGVAPPSPPLAGPPPRLHDAAAFPALGRVGASARHARGGSQSGSEGGQGGAAPSKRTSQEWEGGSNASGASSAAPATLCCPEEAQLRPPSLTGGSVCAESELSLGSAPSGASAGLGSTAAAAAAEPAAAGRHGASLAPSGGSWADIVEEEQQGGEEGWEEGGEQQPEQQAPAPAEQRAPPPPPKPAAVATVVYVQAGAAAVAPLLPPAPRAAPRTSPARPAYQPPLAAAAAAPAHAAAPFLQRMAATGSLDLCTVPAFLCPLTNRPFVHPVVAADGVTYEKEVITDWLFRQNKEVSPVTGRQLAHRLLLPNDCLHAAMGQVAELIRAVVN